MSARAFAALLALAALPPGAPARAQAGDFATLGVRLGAAGQVAAPYGGRWEPGGGLAGRLATPFLGGEGHLGLRAYPNDDASESLPDFLALHAHAGWGPALRLPAGLRLTPAAHVGAVAFRFDDPDRFTGPLKNEIELAAGLALHLDAPLARGVRAWAGADVVRVFTARRERLVFVEGGLGVTLATPAWLRGFLRE